MHKLVVVLVFVQTVGYGATTWAQDIFHATIRGDDAAVTKLLARNPRLVHSRERSKGLTPLHVAAAYGRLRIVQMLLKHGADANAKDNMGSTPLFYAVGRNQTAVAQYLLTHGAKADVAVEQRVDGVSTGKTITPLLLAVRQANPQMVHLLLQHGASVRGASGSAALYSAVSAGNVGIVKVLLQAGADPVSRDNPQSATPLHVAAGNGHLPVMEVLKGYYKSVDTRDNSGRTPLHFAALGGKAQAVRWLLQHGADVNAVDQAGGTALMYGSGMGHTDVVKVLLQQGADVRARDRIGDTALHYACRARKDTGYPVVQILLQHGADRDARNKGGMSPLQVALSRGNLKCAGLLREHGARE